MSSPGERRASLASASPLVRKPRNTPNTRKEMGRKIGSGMFVRGMKADKMTLNICGNAELPPF